MLKIYPQLLLFLFFERKGKNLEKCTVIGPRELCFSVRFVPSVPCVLCVLCAKV